MEDSEPYRLVFVGNLASEANEETLRELFEGGNVSIIDDRHGIDKKGGYAFVKCKIDDELDEKIARLHTSTLPGFEHKPLTIQFAKTDPQELQRKLVRRKQIAVPTSCLFVVGYDPAKLKPHYLEYEFDRVAKVKHVELFKSYAHVYFNSVVDAKTVLEHFNGKDLFGKPLVIEYRTGSSEARKRFDGRGQDYPDRGRGRERDDYRDRRRSPDRYSGPPEYESRPAYDPRGRPDYRPEPAYAYPPDYYNDFGRGPRPPYDPRYPPATLPSRPGYLYRSRSRSRERVPASYRSPGTIPTERGIPPPYLSHQHDLPPPPYSSGREYIPRSAGRFRPDEVAPPSPPSNFPPQHFRREPIDSRRDSSRSPSPDDDKY